MSEVICARSATRQVGSHHSEVLAANSDILPWSHRSDEEPVEAVLAHLRSGENTSVTVRIEIEATDSEGLNESRVRTVSKKALSLRFDQSGFEKY